MIDLRQRIARKSVRVLACQLVVAAGVIGLGGCSGGPDGIELEGKVFDAVGLTSALGPKVEPKAPERAPLVLPPPGQQLSQPGTVASAPVESAATDPAWPNDPDKNKVASASKAKAEQDAYCKDGNWKDKALGDDFSGNDGPHGSCTQSIFGSFSKSLFGE
ncbi:MAG: hypothetical protein ACK5JT_12805 [Hyphomicrobiaceae bacterium]